MSELPLGRLRARLTYANVMSTVAVVAMLSTGTAYAAGRIGSADVIDNSLRTVDVRDGTLTGADIGLDKVGSADVAGLQGGDVLDGSLSGDDVADESIGGADLAPLAGADLADESLDGSELAGNSVGSDEISNGAIGSDELSALAKHQLQPTAHFASGGRFVDTSSTSQNPGVRQVVFSEPVPAGTYVVHVAGTSRNGSQSVRGTNCIVTLGGGGSSTIAGTSLGIDNGTGINAEEFSMNGYGALGAPGEIALECLAPVGEVFVVGNLIATRVSSIS